MQQYKTITKQIGKIYVIQLLNYIIGFLLFIFLTRALSQYEFGIYSILGVSILFLVGLLTFGLEVFLVKELPGKPEKEKQEKFSQIFTFLSISTPIIVVILLIGTFFILNKLEQGAIYLPSLFAFLSAGIIALGSIISNYFYSKKQTVVASIIDFLIKTLWTIPLIIIIFVKKINIDLVFSSKLVITLMVFFIIIIFSKIKNLRFFTRVNKEFIVKALRFSIPLSTLVITQWIITASDRYILGFFHSAIKVGQYSFIYSIMNFIFIFCTAAVIITIFPYAVESFNKGNQKQSNFLLNSSLKYITVLTLPCVAGFFLLAKELVTIISGAKYIETILIVPLLMIFPLAEGANTVFRRALVIHKKTKMVALLYLQAMLINIVLNFILIPKYHYYGAAIATSLTYLILLIQFIIKSKKYVILDHNYLRFSRIVLSTIIMGFSIAFIHPKNIYATLSTICLGVLVYLISLFFTKAYVKGEMDLVKSFISRRKKLDHN